MYFNDCSKIILNPKTKVFYYLEKAILEESKQIINCYNMNKYPDILNKKILLLKNLKKYLFKENEDNIKINKMNENNNENEPYTHMKNWSRTKEFVCFRLSNKIVQFFFTNIIILVKIAFITTKIKKEVLILLQAL